MDHLKPEQIDHLVRMLDARREREVREIAAMTQRARRERGEEAVAGGAADQLDVAMLDTTQAMDDAMVRQNLQDVRDVDAARKRLAAGIYGICVDCGEPVAYARLLAYPTAKRCIACQQRHER